VKFNACKSYIFFPNVSGNLELPEAERLSVEIIRPTAEDRGAITYVELMSKTENESSAARYRFDVRTIFNRCIGEIKNLEVEDVSGSGEARLIKNGKELAKESFYGMGELVDAICTEVCRDVLSDTQKKISESGLISSGEIGTSGN